MSYLGLLRQHLVTVSFLAIQRQKTTLTLGPLSVEPRHQHLKAHASSVHLRYFLVRSVALSNFEFIEAQTSQEPHLLIGCSVGRHFNLLEGKVRHALKVFLGDLPE